MVNNTNQRRKKHRKIKKKLTYFTEKPKHQKQEIEGKETGYTK